MNPEWRRSDDPGGSAHGAASHGRPGADETRLPPGMGALQDAAREAIGATRALLDAAEALVDDPDMAERMSAVVRAATAASRATRSSESSREREADDEGDDGVQSIPVD